MSKLICVDTHILVWGIYEKAPPNREFKVAACKSLIKEIVTDHKILIPTIVLSEYLIMFPKDKHQEILKEFNNSHYIIGSFNTKCAEIFSQIWQNKNNEIEDLRNIHQATKKHLKADCFIVATALAYKATKIYSEDKFMKSFADGYIEVEKIPTI